MGQKLPELKVARDIAKLSKKKRLDGVEVIGAWGSAKTLIAYQTAAALGVSLVHVTAGRIEAEAAFEDLVTFGGDEQCVLFPAWEVLPTDAMSPADDIVAERMNALSRMALANERGERLSVSLPVRSLLQRTVNQDDLARDCVTLEVGGEHDMEALLKRLTALGYERELMVEQRGHMSVRGGIFDIFPISGELPYRVEFFGDEIESIRRFEPETQRSVESVREMQILPRSEKALLSQQAKSPGKLGSILDYVSPCALFVFDEPMAIRAEGERLDTQFPDTPFLCAWAGFSEGLSRYPRLSLAQVAYDKSPTATRLRAQTQSVSNWADRVEGFWEQLQQWDSEGFTVQLYCDNVGERRRLLELLREHGYRPGEDKFDLRIDEGRLRAGFSSSTDKFALLSEREMFGRKYVRRVRRRFSAGTAITAFSDLTAGDYVVHIRHGIGRYLGLKRLPGRPGDFLSIQFAKKDIVYVPVTHIEQVQKYVGGGGAVPKLDRLGGASWARKKASVKKAVHDMTEELLKLYAAREANVGHAFSRDTHWQHEFEDSFEYEETVDQARAILEVKKDMESAEPMERLLCGDVGYGKTEVAIRAAFKSVMDGKQVAVLVPTTILAEQHYSTFRERLADYPVKVEMLSRFRSGKEQKSIIHKMRDGEVDIVIGTHRLTSGDVQFKDLGLVILDEEQRFGVRHKERLKKLKTNVDVLTLSATPIPRTLHLSLSGVRDMSVINTAPNDRLPIHTCIEVFDDKLVTEAIEREIGREGQVFYLHNRVQTIDDVAQMLQGLVPRARIGVAHGQMNERDLEHAMTAFIRHEIDVLVCTTIIGSGLDIPNANTIIIDRADRFGLSELYQLRGRVGRYKHRAFAYLLVPGDRALTAEAQKRLKALEEFSTLGSGFRIAMRDLEIRGSGNLLGGQQSGHIESVGYETYSQLIEEAVAELKGTPVKRHALPPFDIHIEAAIPGHYIALESQKIALYKRISRIGYIDEVDDMLEELTDRFGPPPDEVKRLLEVMAVRALAAELGVTKLAASKDALHIEFATGHLLTEETKDRLNKATNGRIQFTWKDSPGITCALDGECDAVAEGRRIFETLDVE